MHLILGDLITECCAKRGSPEKWRWERTKSLKWDRVRVTYYMPRQIRPAPQNSPCFPCFCLLSRKMPRAEKYYPNASQVLSGSRKKHVCSTCERAFTTSGHLARHTRVHTGERNHKCPFPGCETRCSRQDNLQQQSVVLCIQYLVSHVSLVAIASTCPLAPAATLPGHESAPLWRARCPRRQQRQLQKQLLRQVRQDVGQRRHLRLDPLRRLRMQRCLPQQASLLLLLHDSLPLRLTAI